MPRSGPATSGYQRLAQQEDLTDSDDDESSSLVPSHFASVQPGAPSNSSTTRHSVKRTRSNSSAVDIKVINARLERWADQIANKFKFKKGRGSQHGEPPLEILYSVFVPPEGVRPAITEFGHEGDDAKERFEQAVESVRVAIAKGVDPKLIRQGSSGSYFMRDKDGKIVAVFKPKDEEPYGKLNPKIMKWLHRTLFPCFFGRACLIPNLSYISEAAACLLDRQLRTYMVPYTGIVHISSKAFHYDYWDRRAFYRRGKPLPPKVGSFQVFLQGYQDANIFLRNNPWPDPFNTSFRTDAAPKSRKPWNYTCRPSGDGEDDEEDELESDGTASPAPGQRKFAWTDQIKQNFREELEKLVILDYIMRNTDRGLDNWMVRVDYETGDVGVVSRPMNMNVDGLSAPPSRPTTADPNARSASPMYRVPEQMNAGSQSSTPAQPNATVRIGAIDNSLAFPWKHPDQWRSFPFGWLFLPVSLIGQPFSQKTRDHFIPLLTSTKWWSETQTLLRKLFEQDADFKERMFQKQLAVLKGQAWNVVETLKDPDQGPLELTRRTRVHVWDDEMEVPVAVPLRVPSVDIQLNGRGPSDFDPRGLDEEEMDIGALVSSAPAPHHDLLGFSPPRSTIPSSVRLGLTKSNSATQVDNKRPGDRSPSSTRSMNRTPLHRANMSFDTTMLSRRSLDRRGRRGSHSIGGLLYEDGDEGDLGYSALDGSDGAKKKVIAERLETVKSRNPVFTWC